MRIIGLIGGMSWESTVPYYCQINQVIKRRLGGLHSARLILYSVDFHDIERLMQALVAQGAQAIILGCTEIALLVNSEDATVPLFDTTRIHARAAAQWALSAHS